MKDNLNEIIIYRLTKAGEAFDLAKIAIEKRYWNSAVRRLYYTIFYLITALFAKNNIEINTHSGIKAVFGLQFIKKGLVEAKWGKLLATLFDKRQIGDYGDFVYLTEEEILPLLKEVEEFREMIMKLVRTV